jgi:5'-nucleotidase
MGEDVTYSGTVAAAMEGTILGLPSVALSLGGRTGFDFAALHDTLKRLVAKLLRFPLEANQLLNVNVPNLPPEQIRGVRVTRLGSRQYHDAVVRQQDPRGRDYFWIGGTGPEWSRDERSDAFAIEEGFISVTPLRLDMTDYKAIVDLENLFEQW